MNNTATSTVPAVGAAGADGRFSPIFRLNLEGALLEKVERLTSLIYERVGKAEDRKTILGALQCMLEAHAGEKPRDDGSDGRVHPINVAIMLMELFEVTDAGEVCAAILHDTVEDRPFEFVAFFFGAERSTRQFTPSQVRDMAFEALETEYGRDTAAKIELLTYRKERALLSNPDGSKFFDSGRYLNYIKKIYGCDEGAFRIKICDFHDNGFRLDRVENTARRDELHKRYEPAMLFLRGELECASPGHFLYARRESLLDEIEKFLACPQEASVRP